MKLHYLLLLCQILLLDSYLFSWGKLRQCGTFARLALRMQSSDVLPTELELAEAQPLDSFLDRYVKLPNKLRGAFALETEEGGIALVDFCNENLYQRIALTVQSFQTGTFSSVRVQTFPEPKLHFLKAYVQELKRQTNPPLSALAHNLAANVENKVLANPGQASNEPITSKVLGFDENLGSNPEDLAIQSPFSADSAGGASPAPTSPTATGTPIAPVAFLDLTIANVEKVLDEVRPYLIADGGNVAVAKIDEATRSVYLVLEGACGSCPSSTTTMKMGIERILRENFANLGVVEAVDPSTLPTGITLETVLKSLEKILPAIQGMGGSLEVVGVEGEGVVKVKFAGPQRLRKGVELVLKDDPLVKEVIFLEN